MRTIVYDGLTPALTMPACKRFPIPGKVNRQKLRRLDWVSMKELDQAVGRLLAENGLSGIPLNFIPRYETFDLSHFISPLHYLDFHWITHDDANGHPSRTCVDGTSVRQCPFKRPNLHVMLPWAHHVLKLAQHGIVELDRKGRRDPIGIRWNGREFSSQELAVFLFKES
ncbi:MAG: hypothetical protein AAB381_02545 [Patescibacteria group bacterium]